jgi:hypothetical protein
MQPDKTRTFLTVSSRSIRRICPEARLSRDREGAVSRSGVLMPWFDFFWSAVRSARHLVRSRHSALHPQEIPWRLVHVDACWNGTTIPLEAGRPRDRWSAGLLLFSWIQFTAAAAGMEKETKVPPAPDLISSFAAGP